MKIKQEKTNLTRIVFAMLVITTIGYGQDRINVLYLKNGDIVKGIVVENVPDDYLRIKLQGGSILKYNYSDIEKITDESVESSKDLEQISSETQDKRDIIFFISGSYGSFEIDWPQSGPTSEIIGQPIGFDDIYGSERGGSYGIEVGLGIKNIGIYAVLKQRSWKKEGKPVLIGGVTFSGDVTWTQQFTGYGLRYYLVNSPLSIGKISPFIGIGMIKSSATENMKGEFSFDEFSEYVDIDVDLEGDGYFLESGFDYYIGQNLVIRGQIERSSANLGVSPNGERIEIEGGGGLFIGVLLSLLLG